MMPIHINYFQMHHSLLRNRQGHFSSTIERIGRQLQGERLSRLIFLYARIVLYGQHRVGPKENS